ncbi:WGR domain-containing protein [Brucella rhizosphaerae]
MRRFYTVSLQPTLFGEWSLVRRWGRVGTKGRSLLHTYESEVRARVALDQAVCKRRKRGYVEM